MSNPEDADAALEIAALGDGRYQVKDGERTTLAFAVGGRDTWVFLDGRVYVIASTRTSRTPGSAHDEAGALASPMPATVVSIEAKPGDSVKQDSVLIMLEAMKMELPIKAPRDGRVTAINCRVGELVQPGIPLLELS